MNQQTVSYSGHICKKPVIAMLTWDNEELTGEVVKEGRQFVLHGTVSSKAPYRVKFKLSCGNEHIVAEGFKEKDSFNVFGSVDGGQFSLKQDETVTQKLRAELIDMGFDPDAVDHVMLSKGLNKVSEAWIFYFYFQFGFIFRHRW